MSFTDISFSDTENTQVVGGNIYESPTPSKVLDFSSNTNILGTPKNILKKLRKANISTYPDLEYKKAVLNLSGHHGVGFENIMIENNTYSMLSVILKSLKIRSVTLPVPCETSYSSICRANACDVLPYYLSERQNFKLDCDLFIENITTKSDAVLISNPNNATGRVVSKSDIRLILDYCQSKGIYVIIDETYMDFVPEGQSVVNMIGNYHNLIVIRSVSEYYGVAGINAAYGIASAEIVEIVKSNQLLWQMGMQGCVLLENAYKDEKFDIKTKKWIFGEKKRFMKKIEDIRLIRAIPSDCHYILMSLEEVSAKTVHSRLLKSNVLIRDASGFAGLDGSYIRISMRDEKSNDKIIDELLRCLI